MKLITYRHAGRIRTGVVVPSGVMDCSERIAMLPPDPGNADLDPDEMAPGGMLRLLQAGYRNVWTPFAELLHHESASRGRDEDGPGRERFLGEARYMDARWSEWLHADPAWNPNLSLDTLDASPAFPPRAATRWG